MTLATTEDEGRRRIGSIWLFLSDSHRQCKPSRKEAESAQRRNRSEPSLAAEHQHVKRSSEDRDSGYVKPPCRANQLRARVRAKQPDDDQAHRMQGVVLDGGVPSLQILGRDLVSEGMGAECSQRHSDQSQDRAE